ncbi:MAG: hypothetical protein AAB489_03880 [Patescibacteria group bacterium]
MTEVARETQAHLSAEKRGAIRIAERISEEILKRRPDILAVLLTRRIRRETLETIAQSEKDVLEQLGAQTDSVRQVIIHRVCSDALSSELNEEINRDIRKRHALAQENFTDARRRKSIETRQVHPWNADMDGKLLELMASFVHTDNHLDGNSDWKRITEEMNRIFGVQLSQKLHSGNRPELLLLPRE